MRLFVGIELSSEVVEAAAALVGRLRERAARLAPASRVAWIPSERLHITVRFIGHMSDTVAAGITDTLRLPIRMDSFPVNVQGIGTFPAKGPPRVIWAGIAAGASELKALESLVHERLSRLGIAREDRPYDPHLTLARVHAAAGLTSRVLLEDDHDTTLGVTPVEAITLFESRLSPKGPTYVPLVRTRLAGES